MSKTAALDACIADLPRNYSGPGGAVAVLQRGRVLARHAWGYANAERRIPFTPATLFRMCSITKQFAVGAVLEAGAPSRLDAAIAARLPLLRAAPDALHLMHNQSGLRDYWAVAMLHGAAVEGSFGDAEAARVISTTRSLQFAPGSRFSYVNQNFRLLSDALADVSGRSFAEHLQGIFDRTGMRSALLAADTRAMPDGTEGYEGSVQSGFHPARNNIIWTGDAGLGASLDDMIAWEKHIDATRDDPRSLHARLSAPVTFADGKPAAYGFGLNRSEEFGHALIGHGGALRGWRSHRFHVPALRVSVVVLFNHMADAHAAALDLLAALLRAPRAAAPLMAEPDWLGAWIEPETGLSARIDMAGPGAVRLRFGGGSERLSLQADGSAGTTRTRLRPGPGGLWLDRPQDNLSTRLRPRAGQSAPDIAGRYHCAELDAELTITDAGGAPYGGFSGFLGQGRMEPLQQAGRDIWLLPMPRALDHAPPGDWTLAIRRDATGRVTGMDVGVWLARGLRYRRVAEG